jgi:2-dehydro-3-deoxyphosphooctonate aldolase (KDO 8-P synthase)
MSFYENCHNDKPLSIIAGPCAFENTEHAIMMAEHLKKDCEAIGKSFDREINFIYKTSFDKANRSSADSYRSAGFDEAFYGMEAVRARGIEVLTDVHEPWQCAATNADILQIPAFLCRQTDLLAAAAETGKPVNVKKGQFLSPWEMRNVAEKLRKFGCDKYLFTERGTTFGYNNLVVDFRSLDIMKQYTNSVIMDCTHSLQQPNQQSGVTGGKPQLIETIAKAAIAVGADGLFVETHPDPDKALSDGPLMIRLTRMKELVQQIKEIHELRASFTEIL